MKKELEDMAADIVRMSNAEKEKLFAEVTAYQDMSYLEKVQRYRQWLADNREMRHKADKDFNDNLTNKGDEKNMEPDKKYICICAQECGYEKCPHIRPHNWKGKRCQLLPCKVIEKYVKCVKVEA